MNNEIFFRLLRFHFDERNTRLIERFTEVEQRIEASDILNLRSHT